MLQTDIEISQQAAMKPIFEIAHRLALPEQSVEPYGQYKAKIDFENLPSSADQPDGKLILVTAISPTPAGEGKSTTTVGLGDALNRIGKKAIVCLREPSMGPVFGMKGGGRPVAALPRSCRWKTSTCTLPAIFLRLPWRTTCSQHSSTTTSTTAMPWA
jgi:Mrp family chromosome partitioning ATPase